MGAPGCHGGFGYNSAEQGREELVAEAHSQHFGGVLGVREEFLEQFS